MAKLGRDVRIGIDLVRIQVPVGCPALIWAALTSKPEQGRTQAPIPICARRRGPRRPTANRATDRLCQKRHTGIDGQAAPQAAQVGRFSQTRPRRDAGGFEGCLRARTRRGAGGRQAPGRQAIGGLRARRRAGGRRGLSWLHLPGGVHGRVCRLALRAALLPEEVQDRHQGAEGGHGLIHARLQAAKQDFDAWRSRQGAQ